MINRDDAEEFTQSLGQIAGGSFRQIALAKRLGVPKALGLTTEEWVRSRLGGYVRLSISDRRTAVLELSGEGESNRAIADALGVSHSQVARDLGTNVPPTSENSNENNDRETDNGTNVPPPRGTAGTGDNEWYTPAEYIELARAVLGNIDVDPASSDVAQELVRADEYYTKDISGLDFEWRGRVWLNPPYAQPLIAEFVAKMCSEVKRGYVSAAIMLTHNYTDTAWFQQAAACATAICFTRGRIRFQSPAGEIAAPTQGQAFFYFGDSPDLFADKFSSVGFIVRVVPCRN